MPARAAAPGVDRLLVGPGVDGVVAVEAEMLAHHRRHGAELAPANPELLVAGPLAVAVRLGVPHGAGDVGPPGRHAHEARGDARGGDGSDAALTTPVARLIAGPHHRYVGLAAEVGAPRKEEGVGFALLNLLERGGVVEEGIAVVRIG